MRTSNFILVIIFTVLLSSPKLATAQTWSAVGSGMNAQVNTLANYNSELYAAGTFTIADTNNTNFIAKWNGTSWLPLDQGLSNNVRALSVYKGNYMGGWFIQAGKILQTI